MELAHLVTCGAPGIRSQRYKAMKQFIVWTQDIAPPLSFCIKLKKVLNFKLLGSLLYHGV